MPLNSEMCLSKLLRNKCFVRNKKALNCYAISVILYVIECWKISSEMKKKHKAAETLFCRMMLRMPFPEHGTAVYYGKCIKRDRTSIQAAMAKLLQFYIFTYA